MNAKSGKRKPTLTKERKIFDTISKQIRAGNLDTAAVQMKALERLELIERQERALTWAGLKAEMAKAKAKAGK